MKSGFIAVLGSPNVGKSSLINALVGEKVSIVSPKAQTTRDRIMGILTDDEVQMVFVDTPGVHKPKNKLGEYMEKCIKNAENGCDAIVIVLDSNKPILSKDIVFINKYIGGSTPVYIALNKTDLTGFERVYPQLEKLSPLLKTSEKKGIEDIVPLSAKTKKNVEVLKNLLKRHLTDDILYFDKDDLSDKPVSFMIGEIIREKTLWLLNDEIPHGIGVIIQKIEDGKKQVNIDADIVCEKDSHKEIVIGEGGQMLKEIGTKSRIEIEQLMGKKVFLTLFVKVRKDWRNRGSIINDLGYNN